MIRGAAFRTSLVPLLAAGLLSAGSAGAQPPERSTYIVALSASVDAGSAASAHAQAHGLSVRFVYGHALNGYAAEMSPQAAAALARNPQVRSVTPDRIVGVALPRWCTDESHKKYKPGDPECGSSSEPPPEPSNQTTPTGVLRIGGDLSSTAAGDGSGAVSVDIAVLDTGIDSGHPDLNVVGGVNCSQGPSHRYNDGNGHGTHVAGTIGALDNNHGVTGVAPGARMWAIRVLNNSGYGSWASVICGLDWVTANADVIEVANMSLSGSGSDGPCNDGGLHEAICNTVDSGVTIVVAAANDSDDAANHVPASYDEVITVSALADFDGEPGGNGSPTCRSDEDDTFANFSNYGADIDLIAPGVCIESTWKGGSYNTISGTSMASPHVAGAAALYISANPGDSPDQVKSALQSAGNFDWNDSDDPDGTQEKLLDVSGF